MTTRAPAASTLSTLRSVLISKKRDFESLFEGCTRLRAITYVASPELLLSLLDEGRFQSVELLVGESLTGQYKESLARKTWPERGSLT